MESSQFKQIEIRSAEHCALHRLEAVNLTLDLSVTPLIRQSGLDRRIVLPQPFRKSFHPRNAAMLGLPQQCPLALASGLKNYTKVAVPTTATEGTDSLDNVTPQNLKHCPSVATQPSL
jgi:hypothetical protein